tara:strand:- start:20 stop:772 length:753 start_codon:yes stop_codon:yes gene_type:complete
MSLGLGSSLSSSAYSKTEYAVTRSVQLDGADDHIIINNSVANDIKNIGSMSIWLKNTDAHQNDTIFNLHTGTSNDNKIAILFINQGGSELIRFNSRGSSSNTLLDHPYAVALQDGDGSPAWIHFVATWNRTANTMAMYINGSKVQAGTSAMSDYATTADTIYIGKPGNSNNAFFKGNFSSLSLFDETISDASVTTLYNSGKPGDVSKSGIGGLVAWLPLDEREGNFIDRTSTGADGVPQNTPSQGVEDVP